MYQDVASTTTFNETAIEEATSNSAAPTESSASTPDDLPRNEKQFPFPLIFMLAAWLLLGAAYLFSRWRQKSKSLYIIPRVFVLCSPRTVQFHYELILRVGLPSYEFNPDRHDIDITVQGQHRNEVVPMTRLNTKTLNDEPLITSLSIIVYRLVEMPQLASLILRHSGPFRAWLYVYDFTVIDLSTNKEQYYTINKYIGSLNRVYQLEGERNPANVHYPIDDVPLPVWSTEDLLLTLTTTINLVMLTLAALPINCGNGIKDDLLAILLSTLCGASIIFFLNWLLYFYVRWNQDRREYFNLTSSFCCGWESFVRLATASISVIMGLSAIWLSFKINTWQDSLVWLLSTSDSCLLIIGLWNVARVAQLDQSLVHFGLKLRGIETVGVGMNYSEITSDIQTKSASMSDDGSSRVSANTRVSAQSFGPRSSVKSFGFDAKKMAQQRILSRMITHSSSGVTPDQRVQPHRVVKN